MEGTATPNLRRLSVAIRRMDAPIPVKTGCDAAPLGEFARSLGHKIETQTDTRVLDRESDGRTIGTPSTE